jgi:CheY-like chemotaxis protein
VTAVRDFAERTFRPIAEQKGLGFSVEILPGTPESLHTDEHRLNQVLKNLLANAFKFTEHGGVTLTARRAETGRRFANRILDRAEAVVAFAVKDTGIGIPKDKQQLIFEEFQQADGTTSRKFGGTGLGLSISRAIARLLGGEIRVESVPGEGSTFTLFLPLRYEDPDAGQSPAEPPPVAPAGGAGRGVRGALRSPAAPAPGAAATPAAAAPPAAPAPPAPPAGPTSTYEPPLDAPRVPRPAPLEDGEERRAPMTDGNPAEDDRERLQEGDNVVLVVENDLNFAKVLLEMAREKGFKGLVALDGRTGVDLAHQFQPDAVTLDIDMPGVDGFAVLDRLKRHPDTRHIPVHIISGVGRRHEGLKAGALAYLEKPVSAEALDDAFGRISRFIDSTVKRLLVVEDDAAQRDAIVALIGHDDVEIVAVDSAERALEELQRAPFDCMVLDLGLADMSGFELLERVKGDPDRHDLPIIVYTGKDLSPAEETRLRKYAETIIVKDVKSPERLLDETALFLHRVEATLPEQKRRMLERLHTADAVFHGKRVLVVDDDVRNIFSLTSVLEEHGMEVAFAENGRDAIGYLEAHPDVDVVLMDVMMPEMDGYETTRAVRERPEFKALPIIALTAKAMKGDREKCIAAGASDYITKPVDTEQLLSLMRVWLYR